VSVYRGLGRISLDDDGLTPPPFGQWQELGAKQAGEAYFLYGWSWPEPWGRWSGSRNAAISLPPSGERGEDMVIRLDVLGHTSEKVREQRYKISTSGTVLAEGKVTDVDTIIEVVVPGHLNTRPRLILELSFPDAFLARDGRVLGVGARRLQVLRGQSTQLPAAPQ
jgi:hypothetical protein